MTDTQYDYDSDLPYVATHTGVVIGRFSDEYWAEAFIESRRYGSDYKIIDTTPAPRVPEDASYVTWWEGSLKHVAFRTLDGWRLYARNACPLEDLPGVTPETVFTVLEERKS